MLTNHNCLYNIGSIHTAFEAGYKFMGYGGYIL